MSYHVIRRAAERLGLWISVRDVERMRERIQAGSAVRIAANVDGTELYDVTCRHKVVRVVYAPETGGLLTLYPLPGDPGYTRERGQYRKGNRSRNRRRGRD